MKTGIKALALIWLCLPLFALAASGEKTPGVDSIDIYYEATVLQFTCTVQIKGPNVTDNGADHYTLTLGDADGKVTPGEVKDDRASSDFQLLLVDDAQNSCSSNITGVGVSLTGTTASGSTTLLANKTAGGAQNVGLGFSLRDDASRTLLDINGSGTVIDATQTAMKDGIWLTARLQETRAGLGTKGPFTAQAVFSFDYK